VTTPLPTSDLRCVCVSAQALTHLAALRTHPDVRVLLQEERAWVYWPAQENDLLQHMLSLPGALLFSHREGLWYRLDQHLPVFEVPDDREARPLIHLLSPARVEPASPDPVRPTPLLLRLLPDEIPRPARALECSLETLVHWADSATTQQLQRLQGAWYTGVDGEKRALLLGEQLPALPEERRYWGQAVLLPLGFRPEPDLGEAALREILALPPDSLALVHEEGHEILPRPRQPLTRACVRLAMTANNSPNREGHA
jgi:hypothetical protein